MKKAENKGQTLVEMFNATFGTQVEKVSLEQVQNFHQKALVPVLAFLDYTGLLMTSIRLNDTVRENPRSGFTDEFQQHFGAQETAGAAVSNLSLKTWFDFYSAVGKNLEKALAFTGQKWEDYTFNQVELRVQTEKLTDPEQKALYDRSVDSLNLTVRTANCLGAEDIRYIGQLISKTERQLLETPNLGRKSMNEIKEVLSVLGLTIGTHVGNWKPPGQH